MQYVQFSARMQHLRSVGNGDTADLHQAVSMTFIVYAPNIVACLTLKHRETHGCVVSTVATDALVLKHQLISIFNAD